MTDPAPVRPAFEPLNDVVLGAPDQPPGAGLEIIAPRD